MTAMMVLTDFVACHPLNTYATSIDVHSLVQGISIEIYIELCGHAAFRIEFGLQLSQSGLIGSQSVMPIIISSINISLFPPPSLSFQNYFYIWRKIYELQSTFAHQ